jgi:molybdenum cofactor cytidylyltransferase
MEANSKSTLKHNISGLLLCAGLSGRMGTSKALMIYNELPFAVLIINKLLLVCNEIIVVVGHESEKIEVGIKNYLIADEVSKVKFVLNDNYKAGMFSSLQCGLKQTSKENWILYHFVDQPSIPESFYSEFVNNLPNDCNWFQPSYLNSLGHPILFNKKVSAIILNQDKDSSLRELSDDKRIKREIWDCKYREILKDIDTIEEFNRLNCDS